MGSRAGRRGSGHLLFPAPTALLAQLLQREPVPFTTWHMQSRAYTDRSGTTWQVFQVQRSTQATAAVTPGREFGWLTFMSPTEKRRLAPPPVGWDTATSAELEELCARAKAVNATSATTVSPALIHVPAEVVPRAERPPEVLNEELRDRVRQQARQARASQVPVIDALMQLRLTLERNGIGTASEEFRAARKLFLAVFYFEPRA